jgi:hypothetical protein
MSEPRQAIEATLSAREQALRQRDLDAYLHYFAADFYYREGDGDLLGLTHFRRYLEHAWQAMQPAIDAAELLECVSMQGELATLYIHQHLAWWMGAAPGNAAHKVVEDVWLREEWRETDAGWQVREREVLERKPLYIDGRDYRSESFT